MPLRLALLFHWRTVPECLLFLCVMRAPYPSQVTFDIDMNGILSVSALEKTSGQRAMITIKNSDRLADEMIARMIKEAEQYR